MNHYYQYGVLLRSNGFVDLSSGDTLIDSSRGFHILKWESNRSYQQKYSTIENNIVIEREREYHNLGGWRFLIAYIDNQWIKNHNIHYHSVDHDILKPLHMLFKDSLELKDWLGQENYNDLMIALI